MCIRDSIKTDLSADDVFVFTPKGDVKSLPAGSTIVDFAYAIHTEVGNRMTGAKVDGRIVPLDYQVKTGEIVEIMTTKSLTGAPKRDWIKIAKTSEARNKIRAWFKRERRDENIAEGRTELDKEFRRNYIHFDSDESYQHFMEAVIKRQHKESLDDFYAAIGYGGILLSRIMPRIKDDYAKLMKAHIAENPEFTTLKVPTPCLLYTSNSRQKFPERLLGKSRPEGCIPRRKGCPPCPAGRSVQRNRKNRPERC